MPKLLSQPGEELPRGRMLTGDELAQMTDLSGQALYSAEVKRIPRLSEEAQATYLEAARDGDVDARNELVLHCLDWVRMKAAETYRDRGPAHTDAMDLAAHGSLKMLEAFPTALRARSPIRYLMSVAALEMRRYCIYHDPLIQRTKGVASRPDHPQTVSYDRYAAPLVERLAAPDSRPQPGADDGAMSTLEYRLVHAALGQLTDEHRALLMAAHGLFDQQPLSYAEIAEQLHLSQAVVGARLHTARRHLATLLAPYITEHGLSAV